eukprot:TRINITY_DN21213_c0_g1_i2.p1 TRINITY_DN21213_c0_g1~~TRINITY_DN21213_c0_g1_i2.p1  ORF type:complete len:619 (+),score=138.18 TRINITY_DN21213_c0_g1_i2:229-2085(+)
MSQHPNQQMQRQWQQPQPLQLHPTEPRQPAMTVAAGEMLRVADLQFGELLGAGGFGAVHRGRLLGHPGEVAIKKLHMANGGAGLSQETLLEFQREVNNLQALRHERLIRFIGIAIEPPSLCIVTELAAGGSLHDLLHVRRTALAEVRKWRLALQMTEGVAFLHGQRPAFVHRDLKSANVVLDEDLNAKLCDFGISEPMEKTHISRREAEAGSPRYMAPELFDSRSKLTEKLDVWALGCLTVEVLTTKMPHADCINLQQVASKLLVRQEGPFEDSWAAGYPPEVQQLLNTCFARDLAARPSAAVLLEETWQRKSDGDCKVSWWQTGWKDDAWQQRGNTSWDLQADGRSTWNDCENNWEEAGDNSNWESRCADDKADSNEVPDPCYIDAHDLVLQPVIGDSHRFTMVLLHSCSGGPDDWIPILHRLDLPFRGHVRFVVPCAPVRLEEHPGWTGKMNSWFEYSEDGLDRKHPAQLLEQRERILQLLERERARLPGQDARRLVLAGFSQGVALAADVALHTSNPIGGLLCLRGSVLQSSTKDGAPGSIEGLRILAYHGERDRQCPVDEARQSYETLRSCGASLRFVQDASLGHSCARGRQQLCAGELREVNAFLKDVWADLH